MKITLGEWKTRNGRKAIVAAENPNKLNLCRFVGWIAGNNFGWDIEGSSVSFDTPSPYDLVAPWTEPVPWDWSTTPPWINWICKNSEGQWWATDVEAVMTQGTHWPKGTHHYIIPREYEPKWSGDWKLSKTQRPKEVAK